MSTLKDCMEVTERIQKHVKQIEKCTAALKIFVRDRKALIGREVDTCRYYNSMLEREVTALHNYFILQEQKEYAEKYKRVGAPQDRTGDRQP